KLVRVDSPGHKVRVEFVAPRKEGPKSVPRWRAFFHDRPVILDSRLGLELVGGPAPEGSYAENVSEHSLNVEYDVAVGKRRHIVGHCTETIVTLRERAAPGRVWEVALRAYDDGIAFQYRFPAQEGWPNLVIAQE